VDDASAAGSPPRHVVPGELLGEDMAARLERWAAEARVDDAARQRVRERWLRQQAEEEASLAGVLCDLAERATPAAVRTRTGRWYHGQVRAVGEDFVAVRPGSHAGSAAGPAAGPSHGGDVIVALDAVSSVRTRPGQASTGDRAVRTVLRMAEVLARLAAERERVLLVCSDGDDGVAGTLRSVGRDVAVVRLDGPEPATAYVPIAAIAELIVEPGVDG
jgi:hypothetical protein